MTFEKLINLLFSQSYCNYAPSFIATPVMGKRIIFGFNRCISHYKAKEREEENQNDPHKKVYGPTFV